MNSNNSSLPEQSARQILNGLPPNIRNISLTCPLCGAIVPARGLRAKPLRGVDNGEWQFVFTCPTCGLLTAFNTNNFSPEQIQAMSGSRWIAELRQFKGLTPGELPGITGPVSPRHLIGTFLLTFLVWMLLIGNLHVEEVFWAAFVSLVIAAVTYRFSAIDVPVWTLKPAAWSALLSLAIEFAGQIVVQNITLAIRVFRPDLPIRPGIVAVPTILRDDISLTIL